MKLISVKDKLPDYNVDVFCYSEGYPYIATYVESDRWFWDNGTNGEWLKNVTHWAPLPEIK